MTEALYLNQFNEISLDEIEMINGGGWFGAICAGVLAVAAVAVTCVAAPALVTALVTYGGCTVIGAKVVVGVGIALEVGTGVCSTLAAYYG